LKDIDVASMYFEEKDGALLTSAARSAIESFLKSRSTEVPALLKSDPRFSQKLGCFVTLRENDLETSLRGCIGFPEPSYELWRGLTFAAIEAATRDPRFPPVKLAELSNLTLEVSILTKPEEIKVKRPQEFVEKVEIGKDGLILKWAYGSGLLLPQVAAEYNWTAEEFLCNLSLKAGAPPDQWLIPGTVIFKFNALIFEEDSPKKVVPSRK